MCASEKDCFPLIFQFSVYCVWMSPCLSAGQSPRLCLPWWCNAHALSRILVHKQLTTPSWVQQNCWGSSALDWSRLLWLIWLVTRVQILFFLPCLLSPSGLHRLVERVWHLWTSPVWISKYTRSDVRIFCGVSVTHVFQIKFLCCRLYSSKNYTLKEWKVFVVFCCFQQITFYGSLFLRDVPVRGMCYSQTCLFYCMWGC